jgi:predicted RNase H-like HicB family nuclease
LTKLSNLLNFSTGDFRKGGSLMQLRVVLEPSEDGGFTAYVPSFPGCISEGDTREETIKNIREAIELYLEPVDDDEGFGDKAEILELAL